LEEQLDLRSVGGEGYGVSKEINSKLEELLKRVDVIAAPTVPANLVVGEMDLNEVVDRICGVIDSDYEEEDDVVVCIDSVSNDLEDHFKQATIRKKTQEQLKRRTITVGIHHGKFNPLPCSWKYPEKMNVIQLITLYQMGCPAESVPPLRLLRANLVQHFDKDGGNLSKMRKFMALVKHYGQLRNCWRPRNAYNYWNGATVTKLWDSIWRDMGPLLLTETQLEQGRGKTYHKSRSGQLSWRTCHEKVRKLSVYKALNI
jgi:hypothetical protein